MPVSSIQFKAEIIYVSLFRLFISILQIIQILLSYLEFRVLNLIMIICSDSDLNFASHKFTRAQLQKYEYLFDVRRWSGNKYKLEDRV